MVSLWLTLCLCKFNFHDIDEEVFISKGGLWWVDGGDTVAWQANLIEECQQQGKGCIHKKVPVVSLKFIPPHSSLQEMLLEMHVQTKLLSYFLSKN